MFATDNAAPKSPSRSGWFGAGAVAAATLIFGFLFVGGYLGDSRAVAKPEAGHITIPRQ
ncbi:MAG: hypothetical protein ABWZ57_12190 [Mesorhizobium sp.]|jgi:hypothetical protein